MPNETPLTIIGNLTEDAILRFTPSGAAVANFTCAVTPRKFDRQANDWKDGITTFWDCSVWREQAEHVAESLTKGTRVIVTGTVRTEQWDDKNGGGRRSKVVLDVDEVGPSLRYAQAKVTKAARQDSGGFGGGGGRQQTRQEGGFGGGGQRQAPRQDSARAGDADPWNQPTGGGGTYDWGADQDPPF